ncbi:PAS domain S-box protein [Crocosphaera chwakensis]|uniref:histidine kinase n=1 Tax=Crocosphaera chwakensis CCY0110 TaxID=391612 RepID=A3IKK6_9CHRO|nr:PAS domain S-box protein [Crocosphaera chwakensis]EAZ93195.1 Multi-sensor Signal Transduction Histidine Kinase [Crocosphaera chwakensis CCY0110]
MPSINIRSYKIPLKWVLIFPLVLQLLAAVALVGYLSYRSGQKSVEHLANHLLDEISGRVNDRLDNYLETPQMLIEKNKKALEAGETNWNDFDALEADFFREIEQFESITLLSFGNTQGEVIGVGRDHLGIITDPGSLTIWEARGNAPRVRRFYRVDDQGNRKQVIHTTLNFDVTKTEWYQAAIRQDQPQWTPIFSDISIPVALMSAVRPVYLQGELKGVLHSDILLSDINLFLRSLSIASSEQIFIIEPTGDLVASSTQEKPFVKNGEGTALIRLEAVNSENPLTRAIAQKIQQQWGDLKAIQSDQTIELMVNQEHYYINISPYQNPFGLDWLIITVIPTSKFMHQINANVGSTLILCGITLVSTTLMGMLTAYWIIQPIRRLNQANEALLTGTWQDSLSPQTNIAELLSLTNAFNQTASQLQQSLRRTETALKASQKKFTTIFRMSPDPIMINYCENGRILEVNDRFIEFSGYSYDELTGHTPLELNLFPNVQQHRNFQELLQKIGFTYSQEIAFRVKSGEVKTVLLSAENHCIEQQEYIIVTFRDITESKQLELALKDSRKKLNQILDNTFASIFSFRLFDDQTWEYNYQSIGSLILFGYTPQEIMADQGLWASRIVPEDHETIILPLFERFKTEDTITVEYRFRHKNDSIRWIATTYTSYRDPTIDAWIVTGVSIDISDRKQIESELQQQKDLRESIFENSSDAIFLVDPQSSLIIDCNHRLVELFEVVCKDDLIDIEWHTLQKQLFTDEEVEEIITQIEVKGFWEKEIEYITFKGHEFWGNLTAKLIIVNNQIIHLVRVTDITERKQAQIKLQKSEARYRGIVQDQTEFISRFLPDGTTLFVNEAYCRYFSINASDIIGKNYQPVIYEPDQEQVREQVNSLSKENPITLIENRIVVNGEIRWTQWINRMLFDEQGNFIEYQSVGRDIQELKEAEALLAEEVSRSNTLFDSSIDGIVVIDHQGYVIRSNASFSRMLGYTPEETAKLHLRDWEANYTPEEIEQKIAESDLCKDIFETRHRRKDGSIYDVEISATPVRWGNEIVQLCICRDISDRKEAEAALLRSEARYQNLVVTVPGVIYDYVIYPDGSERFAYISPRCRELLETEPDILKRDFSVFWGMVHPQDLPIILQSKEYSLDNNECFSTEIRIILPSGQIKWIKKTSQPSSKPQADGGRRWSGIMIDISDRKRIELALEESEERFRSAFENAGIGMVLISLEGEFLKVNQAFCGMLGYSEQELLLKNFQEITHPDDLTMSNKGLQQLSSGQIKTYQMEKRYIVASGSIIWCSVTISSIKDQDQHPLYFVTQVQDITERRELDRLKTEFISVVSHELRTPLTSMRGALGLLDSGVLREEPETVEHMLQIVLRNCDRLIRLVNDILNLERLESGKVQLIKEACEVDHLLTDAVETVSAMAMEASINIELTSISAHVWASYDAIIQILTNLLSNAIKFAPEGTTVWLTAQLFDDPDSTDRATSFVLFSVKDQGRGIPTNKLTTIFGRFQQVDASDARQKAGTGLGLAICQSIIQQHNGRIWVDSILGEGSTFYFTLPLCMNIFSLNVYDT